MDLKDKMKNFFSLRLIIGLILGSVAGYIFYTVTGCSNGSCAITSNPWISTGYGMFAGGLLFYKSKEKNIKTTEKENISDR